MLTAFCFIISHRGQDGNKKRAANSRPYNENSPFPNVGADIIRPLCCCIQHVFNEDAVAGCWIVHQYMRHRADQFSCCGAR